MIELILKTLNKVAPTGWLKRPNDKTSISFFRVSEQGEVFTSSGEVETEIIIQVDVWSKKDFTELVKQVKTKMNEIEFYRTYETEDYEKDEKLYHKILRFTHLRNNESDGDE